MRYQTILVVALGVATFLAMVGGPVASEPATQAMVTITVEVVDQNETPLGSATVNASWEGGHATETTKSNGKALVDVPQGERVELNVTHANYVRNFPFVIPSAEDKEYQVDVAQKASATIRTTNVAGEPVAAEVTVIQNGREVTSADSGTDGTFETGTIERGTYEVKVLKPGYFRNQTTLTVAGTVSQTLRIERGSVTVEFAVEDDHFDPARPVQNATVNIQGSGSVQTLSNGEATLQIPVNTWVTATVSKPGYGEVTKRVHVGEQRKSVTVTIRRTPELRLVTANTRVVVGETVRVQVTNEYGTPLEGVTVTLDGNQVGTTDENGVLQVPIEERGTHELRAKTDRRGSETIVVEGVVPGKATPTGDTPTETTGVEIPGFTATAGAIGLFGLLGALVGLKVARFGRD